MTHADSGVPLATRLLQFTLHAVEYLGCRYTRARRPQACFGGPVQPIVCPPGGVRRLAYGEITIKIAMVGVENGAGIKHQNITWLWYPIRRE